jgi:Zn-dependent peptidase ImmA (M78 family)
MNGTVNGRPYIALNENMSPERIRSTAVHELAHFFFSWPEETSEKEREKCCNAISAAFLLPAYDVKREAGLKRTSINYDMTLICREYGISMYVLVERADVCRIISRDIANNFFVSANRKGWKKSEPVRINKEVPLLFQQLVFRAVCENEITVQKGAELLRMPYSYVSENCMPVME